MQYTSLKFMFLLGSSFVVAALSSSCDRLKSSLTVERSNGGVRAKLIKISPIVAKPGDTVTLVGSRFSTVRGTYTVSLTLRSGEVKTAAVSVQNAGMASFVMPDGAGLGLKTLTFSDKKSKIADVSIVADDSTNTLPIYIGLLSDVCSTLPFIDRDGVPQRGSKNCTGLDAADNLQLTPSNIRSGVEISGVSGRFPSSEASLEGAGSVADLTLLTFEEKMKTTAAFEYWDSTGSRHQSAGDGDITSLNITTGITVFGTTGTLVPGPAPNPWDIRKGVAVGGVMGKLFTNCRNTGRSSRFNYDGPVSAIPGSSVVTGTSLDYWDTIDDYNNPLSGIPTEVVTGWANNACNGVEVTPGDDFVWKDVTSAGLGAAGCGGSPENCTMRSKVTGLDWSKRFQYVFNNSTTTLGSATLIVSSTAGLVTGLNLKGTGIPDVTVISSINSATQLTMSSSATASASNVKVTIFPTFTWRLGIKFCDELNHNGFSDWRLPTQKELMEAAVHSARSAASVNWFDELDMADFIASATSDSSLTTSYYQAYLSHGQNLSQSKEFSPASALCVRP